MRIRDLRIDGFGRFANRQFGPFDHAVTVFHGPNEAGKSTLLAFVRRVLFGFPDRRRRLNRYPPLAGGRHGGSMTIISDAGEVVVVRRLAGTRGGAVTLTAESGKPLLDQELPRLLGHHSNDVFRNVFSFTLDELHDEALLNDESVNSQIYSAGLGAARLPDALKSLHDYKSRLFLKGGSKHAIYDVATSLDRVKADLDEIADNALEYRRLSARLKEVEAELKTLNERRREYRSRFDYQLRLESAWIDWNDLVSTEEQLAELAIIEDFPSDGVNRLEALEERIRNARLEHESAERNVEEAEAEANAPIEHEAVLDYSAEIRGLERDRTHFESALRDLPEREAELGGYRKSLAETLSEIGSGWNESDIQTFDLSIADDGEIGRLGDRLRETERDFHIVKANVRGARDALEKAVGRVEHEAILEHSAEIRSLEQNRTHFSSALRDLPERNAELRGHKSSLDEILSDLGPDWDESRLEAFDMSIAVREEISKHHTLLRQAHEELNRCESAFDQAKAAFEEASQAQSDATKKFAAVKPSLDDDQIRQHRALIRSANSRLVEVGSAKKRVASYKNQLDGLAVSATHVGRTNRSEWIAAFGVTVGIALVVIGAALGGSALWIGIAAGIVSVALAALLFLTAQSPTGTDTESPLAAPVRESLRRAEAAQATLESALQRDAESLSLDTIAEPTLIEAESSLDADLEKMREWRTLSEDRDRASELVKRRNSRVEKSSEAVKDARNALEAAESNWKQWLAGRGLHETFSPDAIIELRSKIDLGRNELRSLQSLQGRIDDIQNHVGAYMARVQPLASEFEVAFDMDHPGTAATAADRLVELHGHNENKVRDRTQAKADLEDAQRRLAKGKAEFETARREWKEWLIARNLHQGLNPDAVTRLKEQVKTGRSHLGNVQNWQRRIETIQTSIRAYVETLAPLASKFDIAFDPNDLKTAAVAADWLVELHGHVQDRVRGRTVAEIDLREARRELEDREARLLEAKEELKGLLETGAAIDAEDFRVQAAVHDRQLNLQGKRREALRRLQRLSGPGERLESLKEELRNTDIHSIQAEALRAEEELKSVTERIDGLNRELGSIQNDRERLIGEEESSKLRVEHHRLLEKMRGHAREWTVRAIAENLLKEARRKFERERQPDVVRHSAGFFRGITEGRYETVFSPLGKSEIHVTDSEGGSKRPDQLSRGTREQLFLSLRFGLIRDLGQRSETLPVIVDEALVNFDPIRGMRAASAFMDLAQTNQVLVFTCHPQIVDWFVSAAAKSGAQEPNVIKIE